MYFEVCYDVGNNIYSVNMLSGSEVACRAMAEEHAKRFNYTISSFKQIPPYRVDENLIKGMPLTRAKKF